MNGKYKKLGYINKPVKTIKENKPVKTIKENKPVKTIKETFKVDIDIPKDINKTKQEVFDSIHPTNPSVWGPSFWFILHLGAAHYPETPSPLYKERMKYFILGIPVMVTCEECKDHATAFIESKWNDLDSIVSSRENLASFFCDFHNQVNVRKNKPIFDCNKAISFYRKKMNVPSFSY